MIRKEIRRSDRPIVAMVTDVVYPFHHGGKEIRYYELAQRLAQRAEMHIYTMHWWPGARVHSDEVVTFHAISRSLPLYKGSRRSLMQAVLFALACIRMFGARFDVLEADQIPFLQILVLRAVATIRRKKLVVTWHEVWGRPSWRRYLGPIGIVASFIESLTMRLPDEIIAASPQTADRLRAVLGNRASITVAPSGIDLEDVDKAYAHASTTDLVVVGRLMDHKRIDTLRDVPYHR
jgi:glycosyltransferase involved in cell wall biosynthesis